MADNPIGDAAYDPRVSELITLKKAAEISGHSDSQWRRIVKDGNAWAIKLGRDWFTTEEVAVEYASRDIRPGPKPR